MAFTFTGQPGIIVITITSTSTANDMRQKLTLHMNFWTVDKDTNFDTFISYLYGFLSSKV